MSEPNAPKAKKPRTVHQPTAGPRMYAIATAVMVAGVILFGGLGLMLPPGILDDLVGIMCGIFILIAGTMLVMTIAAAFTSRKTGLTAAESQPVENPNQQPFKPGQRPRKAA